MSNLANREGIPTAGQDSPLEIAKRLVAPMCRQPKEAHWLGVQMGPVTVPGTLMIPPRPDPGERTP